MLALLRPGLSMAAGSKVGLASGAIFPIQRERNRRPRDFVEGWWACPLVAAIPLDQLSSAHSRERENKLPGEIAYGSSRHRRRPSRF
jgi:hypothetical protein